MIKRSILKMTISRYDEKLRKVNSGYFWLLFLKIIGQLISQTHRVVCCILLITPECCQSKIMSILCFFIQIHHNVYIAFTQYLEILRFIIQIHHNVYIALFCQTCIVLLFEKSYTRGLLISHMTPLYKQASYVTSPGWASVTEYLGTLNLLICFANADPE